MCKGRFLKFAFYLYHVDIIRDITGMRIYKANPLVTCKDLCKFRHQLQIKQKIWSAARRGKFFFEGGRHLPAQAYRQSRQHMPGYPIILPVWVAVAKNKCRYQILSAVPFTRDIVLQVCDQAVLGSNNRIYDIPHGDHPHQAAALHYR